MNRKITLSLAAAAATLAASIAMPAIAADLGGWGRGSIKDNYGPAPVSNVSPCYFRTDVGYSWSASPSLRWTGGTPTSLDEKVTRTSMDDTWTGGVGMGCSSGSRGFRYEAMLGYHGQRGIDGTTAPFNNGFVTSTQPIHSAVTSYTGMVNGYFDLGNIRGFVPYIGAGVGLAYHQMDEYTYPVGTPAPYRVTGANDLTLAWSAMAGVAYQVSDRAILDLGYRYIDLGRAATGRADPNSFTPSKLSVDSMTAHEIKVGLRYHFGGSNACCAQPVSMK